MFDKIGDSYFLSRVFLKGDESGNQVIKSRQQRRLEESGSTAESRSIAASVVGCEANGKEDEVVRSIETVEAATFVRDAGSSFPARARVAASLHSARRLYNFLNVQEGQFNRL